MPRSPLLIGVTELRRRPGTQRPVEVSMPLPGLAITTARVPDDADLTIDGVLEAIDHAVTFTGTVSVPWVAECRRCLDEVSGLEVVETREIFEARPVPGETYPIEGDDVDLEPIVRDAALLHLPIAPLCGEDCLGPAPEAFPARPEEDPEAPDPGAEPARDPRWAALDALRED